MKNSNPFRFPQPPKRKINTIDLYFDETDEVRASHLLYEDAIKSPQWEGLSKFQFYVILYDRETGKGPRAHGKDKSNGCFGYRLKFVGYKGKFKPSTLETERNIVLFPSLRNKFLRIGLR